MKKIMLDAGHGGKDSGAVGVNGLREKDYVLEIAKAIKVELKNSDVEVLLTRDTDVFVELSQRSRLANNAKVDCFVSIHNNSFNGNARGLETYAYAQQYNKLATAVHNVIIQENVFENNRGVKYADFAVLRETNMDACLIELGFIDNQADYNILMNPTKIAKIVNGIAKGICNYLEIEYKESQGSINVGSKVKVKSSGTHYATGNPNTQGKPIPDWVKKNVYTISQIKNDIALLQEITSWVYIRDLVIV